MAYKTTNLDSIALTLPVTRSDTLLSTSDLVSTLTEPKAVVLRETSDLSFLDIPVELRLKIYQYLFRDLLFRIHDPNTCRTRASNSSARLLRPSIGRLPTQTSLFTACQTINYEAMPIFLAEAQFRLGCCLLKPSDERINQILSQPLPWSLSERFGSSASMSRVLGNIKHFNVDRSWAAGFLKGLVSLRERLASEPREQTLTARHVVVDIVGSFSDSSSTRGPASGQRSLIQRLLSVAKRATGELSWTWQPRVAGLPLRIFRVVYRPPDGIVRIKYENEMKAGEFRQLTERMRLYFEEMERMSLRIHYDGVLE